MHHNPVHFQTMRVTTPQRSIYARLGYRAGKTAVKAEEKDRLNRTIQEAADLVHLKGAALVMGVVSRSSAGVELESGTFFESGALARMLKGCSQVLLMGATAGHEVMDAISLASSSDDLTRAVVLDAVASEMTDAGLDWIMSYINQDLMRGAKRLTRKRFSAGYGDFALENQKDMYDLLRMEAIGVSITQSCILMPEKSVTAVAGIVAMKEETE